MSRSGSNRSIAPMRPRSPYETRSPSSTCAGRPLPSRPATYLTSGAYVRISRSRSARSFVRLNSCQRTRVSVAWSAMASERIRCLAERPVGKLAHPHGERGGGYCDHPCSSACGGGKNRDRGKAGREGEEEDGEGFPSHLSMMTLTRLGSEATAPPA